MIRHNTGAGRGAALRMEQRPSLRSHRSKPSVRSIMSRSLQQSRPGPAGPSKPLSRSSRAAACRPGHAPRAATGSRRELWRCCEPLTDVALERLDLGRAPLSQTTSGRFQAAIDVSTDNVLRSSPSRRAIAEMCMPSRRRSKIITTFPRVTKPVSLNSSRQCWPVAEQPAPRRSETVSLAKQRNFQPPHSRKIHPALAPNSAIWRRRPHSNLAKHLLHQRTPPAATVAPRFDPCVLAVLSNFLMSAPQKGPILSGRQLL